ncbi:MAG: Na+/H+ antiporter NhaC [Planctomycetes bacterium]|nr:Na+/H+ antiporter NhaC [Planctomycetota bacterium]
MEIKEKSHPLPSLRIALLAPVFMIVVLVGGIVGFGLRIESLLLVSATFATVVALALGHTWEEILRSISERMGRALPAIFILFAVGVLIGCWMVGGTIPYMVYLGLEIISPQYIVLTAFLVTVAISVSTGTSWGSAGTVGAAMMGVAVSMGAPLPAVAGAVVSGAYFGDKMSPLSDSTNLAAIAAGTNLYKHIGHMLYTTVPGFVICCVVYTLAGMSFSASGGVTIGSVQETLAGLDAIFTLHMPYGLLLLVPPAIVIYGSVTKKPTIPVMFISAFAAVLNALAFQGFGIIDCADSAITGFTMEMAAGKGVAVDALIPDITRLLQRGGMNSMMSTFMITVCSFSFVGALSVTRSLDVIMPRLTSNIQRTGQLIRMTMISGIVSIVATGNASVSYFLIGDMFKKDYLKRGLQPKNLSRTMEDAITVVEPIVPWTLAGVFMTATLGVPTFSYLPWACLCYTGVIFGLLWGYLNVGIARIRDGEEGDEEY